ncbi:MAG: efflux RND transporter periplasmic adaptor subunit [Pseudomonadota bacterium]
MRIPRSVLTAGLILLALVAYFGINSYLNTPGPNAGTAQSPSESTSDTRPTVLVRAVITEPHTVYQSFKGRTEAIRTVTVRSETTGTVASTPAIEGRIVERGQILCGLALESREARLAEAQAAVTSNELEYVSAAALQEKGWTTSNRAAALKAELDQAEAALAAAEIEIEKTQIRSPFQGVFENRLAEQGDFLSPGAGCGDVVDLDPLQVAFQASEESIAYIQQGQNAQVTLTDGRILEGEVRFVSRSADERTRTFRVELSVPNADFAIPSGLTANIRLALGQAPAVLLTPASLVLHDDGRVGVRYVDATDTVRFVEVVVIDDVIDGIWVTGLPEGARLLLQGQDFVREGTAVIPTEAEES